MEHRPVSDSNPAIQAAGAHIRRRFFRRHPEIWAAVLLWLASNCFIATFSTLMRWEAGAKYYGMQNLCIWDCYLYSQVLDRGYGHSPLGDPMWAFSPVFPLSAYPLRYWLKLPSPLSLVIAGKAAFLLGIYAFLLMVKDQVHTTADRWKAGSLVAFNPYLIYAHAGYAEPLFFALLAFAFYFAWQRRWILSGAFGGLVSGTRILGFLFTLSYVLVCLKEAGWRNLSRKTTRVQLIGFLLCPLGTALYMLYLYQISGDALAQAHIQYAWGRSLGGNPFNVLASYFTLHHWPRVWGTMAVAALVAGGWLFKARKPELGIFLVLYLLIPLVSSYYAVPRYVFWQPAFLYAVFCLLKRYSGFWTVYTAFAGGMASFMIFGWFSLHEFVM